MAVFTKTFKDGVMWRLRLAVPIVLAVFLIILGGCGEERESGELIMWLVGSEGQAQTINELAEEFFQATGIKVRSEAISWGEAHSKYLTSVAGGVAPDIGTMGLTWGTEFGSLGAMVDLNESFPEDLKEIKSQTFPTIWAATEYKGKVFGIPFDMTEHIMYYRDDIIQRPPQTWGELTDILEELAGEERGMIFDWGSMGWIGYAPFLWQSGGGFYNLEGTEATLNTPEAARAMKFFAELYTRYHVPKAKIPVEQGLRTGDFPLAISGNWKIIGLVLGAPEIEGKWRIAMLPAGPSGKRTAFIGGRVMGIFAQSNHKEEAWEFLKFLFRPDTQVKLYEGAQKTQDTYLPPNMGTWDGLPMEPKFRDVLMGQAMDAKGPPSVLGWDFSTRFIDVAIQKVILEGVDPEEALAKANKEMNERIRR